MARGWLAAAGPRAVQGGPILPRGAGRGAHSSGGARPAAAGRAAVGHSRRQGHADGPAQVTVYSRLGRFV